MKTGRLQLYIKGTDGWLHPVFDDEGNPIKCETFARMEEIIKTRLLYQNLKEGESFVTVENW